VLDFQKSEKTRSMNDKVSEADLLRYQLAESTLREAQLSLRLAQRDKEDVVNGFTLKYALKPGDTVRPDGTIERAPATSPPHSGDSA
jgi:hypothetical protein